MFRVYERNQCFWFPFHFLREDKQSGDHILDCVLEKAIVEIDALDGFQIMFYPVHSSLHTEKLSLTVLLKVVKR